MQLFAHEGITPGIRRAFVVYLACGNRPMHEVLFTSLRDIQYDYKHNFQGMTIEPVPLDALLAARERMMHEIQQGLDDSERRFLLSLVAGTPDWSLLGIAASAALSPPQQRGKAIAVIVGGMASGTVLGVPLSLLLAERVG